MRIATVCASIVLAGATAAAEGAGPVAEGGCGFAQVPVIDAPRVTELRDDDCLVYFTVGPDGWLGDVSAECRDERWESAVIEGFESAVYAITDGTGQPCGYIGSRQTFPIEIRSDSDLTP